MTEQPFIPTDPEGGLILAVRLPGGARLGWDDLAIESDRPAWIHLDRTRERAQAWLREQAGLDRLAVESLLAEETRPRVQHFPGGTLVILRGVNLNEGAEPDELIVVRIWVEPARIMTLRQFRFRAIADLRARAELGTAPETAGGCLAAIATGLSLRLDPVVANLQTLLDAIEEAMIEGEADDPSWRGQLAEIRRQSISLRRYLAPQRDALIGLSIDPPALLTRTETTELRIAGEHTARIVEALEEIRDRAAVTQDELRARHEARLGRTIYLLTIVATVALPLGLLTGLLGINVGGIPLADSGWGFVAVCALLAVVAAIQVAFFRRMRWL